jgi:LacI family transcriptional regulator
MIKVPRVIISIETATEYGRELIHGIARYSHVHGPWIFFCECRSKGEPLPNLKRWDADGVIARDVSRIGENYSREIPIIITNTSEPISNYPHVICDNESVGAMAAEFLLRKGRTHFAYCGCSDTVWGNERRISIRKAIQNAGFTTHEFMQHRTEVRQNWETQFALLINWLKSLPLPVSIMCSNDERAHQLIQAATVLGLHIPGEVLVMGADNDTVICELTNPPLTSILFSYEQAGFDSAALLDKMMKGEKVENQTVVIKPVRIIERQSTDILQATNPDIARAYYFIKTYANKGIQVIDVADFAMLSLRSLQIKFKNLFHHSVHKEIQLQQVEFAAKLLIETTLPINKIAEASGFRTSEYMSQVFRKTKGVSLRDYRKHHSRE